MKARLGYSASMFLRQEFLQSLYNQLKNKHNILVGKKVSFIEHEADSVFVHCLDGSVYEGDIVIGADGIHSKVRQEMHRIADKKSPGLMDDDKELITAEYKAIWGTSKHNALLKTGGMHVASDIDHSSLLFVGKDSLPMWIFILKMDRKYQASELPRLTQVSINAAFSAANIPQVSCARGLREQVTLCLLGTQY